MSKKNRQTHAARRKSLEPLSQLQLHEIHNQKVVEQRLRQAPTPKSPVKSLIHALRCPVLYKGALPKEEAVFCIEYSQARTILEDDQVCIPVY